MLAILTVLALRAIPQSLDASNPPRLAVIRSYLPSLITVACFDSMAIKARVLKGRGVSDAVIAMFLRAIKAFPRPQVISN